MLIERTHDERFDPSWTVCFSLNGVRQTLAVDPSWTLFEVLRQQLDLIGTKGACLEGECGSCSVLVDGLAMNACLIMAPQVEGRSVVTVEGLQTQGRLSPVQQAYVACGAVQCGYCTPGLVVATEGLLAQDPSPSPERIRRGLEGNICRCTGYMKIQQAVELACALRRGDPPHEEPRNA
ncbi:MAG: (2Fe-2S)-binding protein [Candidatus Sericytochromatia bacterium]|nr:(2Fe-2S)-binding protein [Candidatus Sericytochromatia bacterium]